MKVRNFVSGLSAMKSLFAHLALFAVLLGLMFFAVVPWPSTVYVLFGICASSRDYIAGECSGNTYNWDWCVTTKFVRRMKSSECTASGGLIYFDKKQADREYRRLNPDQPAGNTRKSPG